MKLAVAVGGNSFSFSGGACEFENLAAQAVFAKVLDPEGVVPALDALAQVIDDATAAIQADLDTIHSLLQA